jgi:hypothetical protein
VDDDLAGSPVLCPACQERVIVPAQNPPGSQLQRVSGLACPRCQSAEVAELPPNPISPDRGFTCLACGAKLRGTTAIYLAAIAFSLGLLVVATGMVPMFGDDRDEKLVKFVRGFGGSWVSSLFVIPLYVLVLGFSVRQMLRPKPRRIRTGAA